MNDNHYCMYHVQMNNYYCKMLLITNHKLKVDNGMMFSTYIFRILLLLGGNGTPSIYQNSDTMSHAHESTEINLMEGQFMATLEKEMKNQPWMPVCTPEHLSCP